MKNKIRYNLVPAIQREYDFRNVYLWFWF